MRERKKKNNKLFHADFNHLATTFSYTYCLYYCILAGAGTSGVHM